MIVENGYEDGTAGAQRTHWYQPKERILHTRTD